MNLLRQFFRLSIRWQVTIASVALLVVAFTVVSVLAFRHSAQVMLGLVLDRLDSEARATESLILDDLNDIRRTLHAAVTFQDLRAAVTAEPQQPTAPADSRPNAIEPDGTLQLLLRQHPAAVAALLCRLDGTVVTGVVDRRFSAVRSENDAPQAEPAEPFAELDRRVLQQIGQEASLRGPGDAYVSDVTAVRLQDRTVAALFVAAAFEEVDRSQQPAALMLLLDARSFFGRVRDLIRDADVDVVDQLGRYLLCTRAPEKELSSRLYRQDKPVRAALLARPDGPDTYRQVIDGSRRPDGRSLIAIYRKVYFDPADRSRFWAIAPDVEVASVMTVYDRFRNTVMVWILLVVAVAAVGNYVASGMLTASLLRLAQAARRIAAGELHAAIPDVPPIGELPILANAFRDMTRNLRQTIEHVEKQQRELQEVLDSTADGIIVIDTEGIIQTINQSACTMFGFDREELLGQNVNRLMPAEIAREHDGYLRRYLQTGRRWVIGTEREITGQRKDGSLVPLALRVTEATIGGRKTFIGTVQDITERKRLAEQREKTVAGLQEAVRELTASGHRIVQLADEESNVVTEQMAAVSQATSAVRQIEAAAQQTAEHARRIARSAADTRHVADDGLAAVRNAVEAMNEAAARVDEASGHIVSLADRAQAISQIIATVNEIAEQTNLLALNAAIEASRAGEHGKGFAVVANEVKSLAEESKAATTQIRRILSEIQQATNRAVMSTEQGTRTVTRAQQIVNQARDTIDSLAEVVHRTGDAMQQIVEATGQQVIGIGQISGAISDVSVGAQRLQQHSRKLVQAADVLSYTADELDHLARDIH